MTASDYFDELTMPPENLSQELDGLVRILLDARTSVWERAMALFEMITEIWTIDTSLEIDERTRADASSRVRCEALQVALSHILEAIEQPTWPGVDWLSDRRSALKYFLANGGFGRLRHAPSAMKIEKQFRADRAELLQVGRLVSIPVRSKSNKVPETHTSALNLCEDRAIRSIFRLTYGKTYLSKWYQQRRSALPYAYLLAVSKPHLFRRFPKLTSKMFARRLVRRAQRIDMVLDFIARYNVACQQLADAGYSCKPLKLPPGYKLPDVTIECGSWPKQVSSKPGSAAARLRAR